MSTYIEVQDRINNDYLNRSVFGAETKRAIQAAIRAHQTRRWNFNETSTALTCVVSQTYITLPSNFLILDDLRLNDGVNNLKLIERDPDWIRNMNTAPTFGQPTDFSLYENRINLFAGPSSAYSIPIYYIKTLSLLSADSDTNAWIQGAMEDVIAYHATKLMWSNVIRNDQQAVKFDLLEQRALANAETQHVQYRGGRLKATRF